MSTAPADSAAAAAAAAASTAEAGTLPETDAEFDARALEAIVPIIEELRPFLQEDGGDCELIKVEDRVVYVRLVGACVGCPSSQATLRNGVENRIREAVPGIEAVEMV